MSSELANVALLCFFVVMGVLILVRGINNLTKSIESSKWPTAEGVLLDCDLLAFTNKTVGKKTYSVRVNYQYEVNGKSFSSDRLKIWSGDFLSEEKSYAIYNSLKNSKQLKVYYNPRDIAYSTLLVGVGEKKYSHIIWGVLIITVSLPILISDIVNL